MNRLRSMRWETLLVCAVSIAVAGCAAVPAAIPVVVVTDTAAPSTTVPENPTATPPPAATAPEPTATQPAASGQRLRLRNVGDKDILKLTALFPDLVRVPFGDLAAGQTSEYVDVPGAGVYGYAAYEYELNGAMTVQPVIDWVGEVPMEGTAFTYSIRSIVTDEGYDFIELVEVTRDE
jgi:hypothetical protein